MLAVIKTGGKQYLVREGESFKVEKIPGKEKSKVTFEQVLLVSDNKGTRLGNPLLKSTKISATIEKQGKHPKSFGVKFKSKKRYKRIIGYRKPYTQIKIDKISI
jgi:large subunit ribosomal protein L21